MFWGFLGFFWRVHCGCYKQLQPCITALAAAQAYLEDLADVSVVPLLLFFFFYNFIRPLISQLQQSTMPHITKTVLQM